MELLGILVGAVIWGCVGGGIAVFVNHRRGNEGGFKVGFIAGCALSLITTML